MLRLTIIALLTVFVLVLYYKQYSENFGVCSDCDHDPTVTGTINPMIWPCSATPAINNKFVWFGSDPNKPLVKSTDDAEALLPENVSGMNVLTVPDQEYQTN